MAELNSIDIARNIRKVDNNIYNISKNYVQERYEVRAYWYLLKPINFQELEKHILTCIKKIEKNKNKSNTYKIYSSKKIDRSSKKEHANTYKK